jgi:hypothetical protein
MEPAKTWGKIIKVSPAPNSGTEQTQQPSNALSSFSRKQQIQKTDQHSGELFSNSFLELHFFDAEASEKNRFGENH